MYLFTYYLFRTILSMYFSLDDKFAFSFFKFSFSTLKNETNNKQKYFIQYYNILVVEMNVYLYTRPLRIHDLKSMDAQVKNVGPCTPIFVFTSDQVLRRESKNYNSNSIQFMVECIQDLQSEIQKKGGKLYLFMGKTLDILMEIDKTIKINSVSFSNDYTPYSIKREEDIRIFAKSRNILVFEEEDNSLFGIRNGALNKKDQSYYKVFTPFLKNALLKKVPCATNLSKTKRFKRHPKLESVKGFISISEMKKTYCYNKNVPVKGGRRKALEILKNLKKFENYNECNRFFDYKTTRLSAYINFGCVSAREVWYAVESQLKKKGDTITRNLLWREFYQSIVYHRPDMLQNQISDRRNELFRNIDNQWNNDKKLLKKWEEGTLGIPICDACMRELDKTGYISGRARLIVSSIICKTFKIDWVYCERVFARKLVDYNSIMNVGNWNWQVGGIDPMQKFRSFNPFIQSKKYDPDASYMKLWVPELNDLRPEDIHKLNIITKKNI